MNRFLHGFPQYCTDFCTAAVQLFFYLQILPTFAIVERQAMQ